MGEWLCVCGVLRYCGWHHRKKFYLENFTVLCTSGPWQGTHVKYVLPWRLWCVGIRVLPNDPSIWYMLSTRLSSFIACAPPLPMRQGWGTGKASASIGQINQSKEIRSVTDHAHPAAVTLHVLNWNWDDCWVSHSGSSAVNEKTLVIFICLIIACYSFIHTICISVYPSIYVSNICLSDFTDLYLYLFIYLFILLMY